MELANAGGLSSPELRELHQRVVKHLTAPRKIVDGNEEHTSLQRFSM